MEISVRADDGAGEIGVHLAFAVRKRLVEQPRPCLRLVVVDVVDFVAVAGAAVAVVEDEFVGRAAHELRVGAVLFAFARHGFDAFERRDVQRLLRAEIDQRAGVHVAGEMDEIVVVERHRDVVVGIPSSA